MSLKIVLIALLIAAVYFVAIVPVWEGTETFLPRTEQTRTEQPARPMHIESDSAIDRRRA